jgi:hypothetical protein
MPLKTLHETSFDNLPSRVHTGPRIARKPATVLERTTFKTSRLAEFCSRRELIAQTGHQVRDWPLVVLKELTDNALDIRGEPGARASDVLELVAPSSRRTRAGSGEARVVASPHRRTGRASHCSRRFTTEALVLAGMEVLF